ncbi:MAG: TolC family protein [Bacteroidales bacterium]|nr:TolC family protein [Bacteroidales bacterium]
MRLKTNLMILLAVLALVRTNGQDKLSFSLGDAIQHAIEYNKTVKNAGLAIDESRKIYNETLSAGLPQANVTLDYSNFLGAEIELSFAEGMPAQKIPFNPTSNLNLTVSQLIFNGAYIIGLQSARLYKELTETSYHKTEQNIREQVTKSYYNALVSDLSIGILLKNLDNTKAIFEKTKAMVSAGMAEKLDTDQFEVQLTSLGNALKSAERQKELSYNLLRFQLGVPVDTPVELTDSINGLMEAFGYELLMGSDFSLRDNVDFQLMLTQEKLSASQVTMQKMNYLPTITGFYSYTNKILKPEFDIQPKNVVGLNLSIPIFSSGQRNAQLSQARIQYETTLNNKELLTDQLLLQVKQARFNLATEMEQHENRKKNVDVAYRIYKNYQLKYEQGVASSLDLTISNNNYLQAETEYLMSIISLINAKVELKKLMNIL